MNLHALFDLVLDCHIARNEMLRCKNKANFHIACRKMDGPRTPRDERRRAQHNEGEQLANY